ncbi:PspC domain-containing protein [Sphaerisporangium sp. NPDC049002]|uniref:PspC domain-containing protein n=1 Tax=Sphaerisporangium sp. NPDC049002 TaxID=3155392 RepID=UPI0033E6E3FC
MLKRTDEGRMLTGVCAGLGRHTGMDPVIFRVGFAALVVGSGIGIMLYVAAFLLMRSPDGGPGYAEQWSRRVFDTETVMALLAAVFALGLIINLAADGISTATVVVGTLLAIALLAAHAQGADLLALARSLPERVRGKPLSDSVPPADAVADAVPGAGARPGTDAVPGAAARPGGGAVPGAAAVPEYRRLSDLAQEARDASPGRAVHAPMDAPHAGPSPAGPPPAAPEIPVSSGSSRYGPVRLGGGFDSSGEPFAPRGPYSRYAPPQPYEPHDWGYGGGGAGLARPDRPKRPKSFTGAITMFVAFVVGGIMVAAQSSSSTFNLPVVGGVVLITIGSGLLVATWLGRGAGLVATGTIMSLLLVAGSTVNGIPKKIGSYTWEPVDSSQAVRSYAVGIGDGTLDLRETKLAPGSRTRFDASVSIGELKIIVPRTARVEVFGYTRLGDVKIEHSVQGGADVHHDKVLEPDVASSGTAPVIELHIKAGIGDVEVHRAA